MKITFHGAAQTVTGSQHLIEVNGRRLLLECGFYQGPRAESRRRNETFPFNPRDLDAVILSHAHIDHSGNLPNLVKQGYAGSIYTTKPTSALTDVMLRDSGHLQEADEAYLNKKQRENGRHNQPLIRPLYTEEDAAAVAHSIRPVRYGETFTPVSGVSAHLVDAGHILGSAAVVLDIEEAGGKQTRLWFSGDIGRRGLPLLRDPILPDRADILLMECTYGDKEHESPEEAYQNFILAVGRTVRRGGKVIIPAFAVGRTQELVYFLNQAIQAGDLPRIPVFVDSPLAVEASQVFQKHPDCFDEETVSFVRQARHPALTFESLTYVQSVEESKSLNGRPEPMVIISASGMAETGRILHHLKNNIEDPKNTVLIVSYQAAETLGRRLAEKQPRVRIFGDEYQRRAEVVVIDGLSAHAGRDLLIEYALHTKDTLKRVALVHGEVGPARALMNTLLDRGIPKVDYPSLRESMEV